jgi:O-succinylbenzoate synthase
MRLVGLDLHRFRLPLDAPEAVAGRPLVERRGLLLRAELQGGAAGWGEASPLPGFSRESTDDALRQLRALRAALSGRDLRGALALCGGLHPSAAFGLETCLLAAEAAARGGALRALLGGGGSRVPVCAYLGDAAAGLRAAAEGARRGGYACVKIKVGRQPVALDLAAVREASCVLGSAVRLRLDANRAWGRGEAEAFCAGLAGLPVDYVEEPLRDPLEAASLAGRSPVALAADETAVEYGERLWEACGPFGAVVLKPTLLGGLRRAAELAAAARARGSQVAISSSYESGVGALALAELSAALGAGPAGLDPVRRLARDTVEPGVSIEGGFIDLDVSGMERQAVDMSVLEDAGDD